MFRIIPIILITATAFAQVQFTVQTDTTVYPVGTPMEITGTIIPGSLVMEIGIR